MTIQVSKESLSPETSISHGARMLRWRGKGLSTSVQVFLHGLGDGADMWRPVMQAWPGSHVATLALDLPGHGGSERFESNQYNVENLARWVVKVLMREGIRTPTLIGHSLGARVALEIAASGALTPDRVVLVDMNPDSRRAVGDAVHKHIDEVIAGAPSLDLLVEQIAARMPLANRSLLKQVFGELCAVNADPLQMGVRVPLDPSVKQLLSPCNRSDAWTQLSHLGCPGIVVRGAVSSVINEATANKMIETLRYPAGSFCIAKAGHAILLEQAGALAEALARAVSRGVR